MTNEQEEAGRMTIKCQIVGCRRRGTVKYKIESRLKAGIIPFTINICPEDLYEITKHNNKLMIS